MKAKLNPKDILLCLIYEAGIVEGVTKLQKMVFLLQKERKIPLNYKFEPYDQGPYSLELRYKHMSSLINLGFVNEVYVTGVYPTFQYSLSESGKAYVESEAKNTLRPKIKQAIRDIVTKWNNRLGRDIINYVHNHYPSYKL